MKINKIYQCRSHGMTLDGFNIPFNALFGTDSRGRWILTRPTYSDSTHSFRMPLYRMSSNGTWHCSLESSSTTRSLYKYFTENKISTVGSFREAPTSSRNEKIVSMQSCGERKANYAYNLRPTNRDTSHVLTDVSPIYEVSSWR